MRKKVEFAAFAAGCFWHIEDVFSKLSGVIETEVGYMGGKFKNPNYKLVCTGNTGHAESVRIKFDSSKISYKKLLDVFWSIHNPTTLNRQGLDIGTQYRSAIFYYTEQQKKEALESKESLQKKLSRKIVTEIVKAKPFYRAEEYHQKYHKKHGMQRLKAMTKQIINSLQLFILF